MKVEAAILSSSFTILYSLFPIGYRLSFPRSANLDKGCASCYTPQRLGSSHSQCESFSRHYEATPPAERMCVDTIGETTTTDHAVVASFFMLTTLNYS